MHRPRDEAIVDDDVLFDTESGVAALEVARAVAPDPLA